MLKTDIAAIRIYANMTPLVTSELFSEFKGEYPVFLSDSIF